jgi:predicted acylesterase/phospholipase RssA
MKIGISCSGGGFRAAFQAGVVKGLVDAGEKPDVIMGTSGGSLCSIGYAYLGADQACHEWTSLKKINEAIVDNRIIGYVFSSGIYDPTKLFAKVKRIVGTGKPRCHVGVTYVDAKTGLLHLGERGTDKPLLPGPLDNDFAGAAFSSNLIPAFIEPYKAKGSYFYDGGVIDINPLRWLIKAGCERIYVTLTRPLKTTAENDNWKPGGVFLGLGHIASHGLRAVDLLQNEILRGDIERALQVNVAVAQGDVSTLARGKRHIDIRIVAPREDLGYDVLEFDREKISRAVEWGVRAGWESV